MNRPKLIFSLAITLVVFSLAITTVFLMREKITTSLGMNVADTSTRGGLPIIQPPFSLKNAFIVSGNSVVIPNLTGNNNTLNAPAASSVVSAPITASSLQDVAHIVAGERTADTSSVAALAFPDVPDSELAIDPSGASTTIEYLTYFNSHAKDIVFNTSEFKKNLKDKNGLILFVPNLVDKAIADNSFSEIKDSLIVQKDFALAEINFLKSIKVTGVAIAINKRAIGAEELAINLADKAILVGSGSLTKLDFVNYYSQFNVAMSSARQDIAAQSGILSLGKNDNEGIVGRILNFFGFKTRAVAQSSPTPFGGKVLTILPCDCDVGDWVVVGPPVPASLFVSYVFLASPLFFPEHAYYEGAWWLGLYWPEPLVPCDSEAALCGPIGFGGEIIMTGTSL